MWVSEGVGPKHIQKGGYNGTILFKPEDVEEWANTLYLTDKFRRRPKRSA